MCYPVCRMVHIKEPQLLIEKSSSCCGGSGFRFYLSAPLPYVRRHITVNQCAEYGMSLYKTFFSFLVRPKKKQPKKHSTKNPHIIWRLSDYVRCQTCQDVSVWKPLTLALFTELSTRILNFTFLTTRSLRPSFSRS